jgi:FlaG/FlaF family flagellin (archaellin)
MNKNFRNSRKAIAPAIAVALLLAVTIALVAAVGYATSNVTPSAEPAPQGVFEVEVSKLGGAMCGGEVRIRQYSGDPIDTQNIKLKFVAKGVATEVTPNGNNTFYMAWNLYNPDDNPYWSYSWEGENPPGTEEYEENNELSSNPQTFVGVHICDTIGGFWLGEIPEVRLFNETSETWTDPLVEGTPIEYTEAWHGATATYHNFSIANPDNTNFTKVMIKNADGIESTYPLNDEMHDGDLNAGDAIFARMHEYNSPYRYSVAYLPTEDANVHFGKCSIVPGDTIKAHGTGGYGVDAITALISNWENVISGDVVEVYIIYNPTNQVIWQGDVIVG